MSRAGTVVMLAFFSLCILRNNVFQSNPITDMEKFAPEQCQSLTPAFVVIKFYYFLLIDI